ncbi:hypothetical protein ACEYW6_21310 [Nostoc sp. UIC 10607]|uniref:hypothetical protein n=1 Tax=Nostoc sp. UIC 10607 TaxID=3045935 RepID=UPI0039A22D02
MKAIEKKPILTEITKEEASSFSGGGPISYLIYMQLAQTPGSPGGTIITAGERLNGWNILINAAPPVNGIISP